VASLFLNIQCCDLPPCALITINNYYDYNYNNDEDDDDDDDDDNDVA